MCEFCVKHGEGKKWYLNAKNYSDELLADLRRRELVKNVFYRVDKMYKRDFQLYKLIPNKFPILGILKKWTAQRILKYQHWGQVIPIEDVSVILSMASSIVRIPCICRKVSTGKEVRTCFLTIMNPDSLGIAGLLDQSYFGGPDVAKFEKVDKKDVLNFLSKQETKGMAHSIWTHGTPFIGGICSCDDSGCLGMKMYREETPAFFKAEYRVVVDKDKCSGCFACIKNCLFGALSQDNLNKKVKIDLKKCYGCGICRSVCNKGALALKNCAYFSKVIF